MKKTFKKTIHRIDRKHECCLGSIFFKRFFDRSGNNAGSCIFLASIMFGLAFIRTNGLSMPVGFHFMANWVQGNLFGFGVSGNEETSFLKSIFNEAPQWLTGGSFGLEASIPGLVCVVITIIFLYKWKPARKENSYA